jgi:hypothetical protein
LKQVKVIVEGNETVDDQGLIKKNIHLDPGARASWSIGFRLEKSGKVQLSDPW